MGPLLHRRGFEAELRPLQQQASLSCTPFHPLSFQSWLNLHPSASSRGRQEGRAGESQFHFPFLPLSSFLFFFFFCHNAELIWAATPVPNPTFPFLFAPPLTLNDCFFQKYSLSAHGVSGVLGCTVWRGDWSQVRERGQAHSLVWEMKCRLALAWQKEATAVAVKSLGFRVRQTQTWISASLLISCVTLGKSHCYPDPEFSHLYNGKNNHYLAQLLRI